MNVALFFSTADETQTFRAHSSFLSQQDLMELFVEDSVLKKNYIDANGDFLNVSEWPGIECNASGDVVKVIVNAISRDGNGLQMQFLPKTIQNVDMHNLRVTGTLPCKELPPMLDFLNIGNNKFEGSLLFGELPNTLQFAFFENNKFVCIPESMHDKFPSRRL